MKHILLAISLILAALLSGPAHAQKQPVQLVGLELGMSPDEALSILEGAGYVPFEDPYKRPNFDDQFSPTYDVIIDETRRLGKFDSSALASVEGTVLAKALRVKEDTHESVELAFLGFESGQKLVNVVYKNQSPELAFEVLRERVISRYGKPDGESTWPVELVWNIGTLDVDGIPARDSLKFRNSGGSSWIERSLFLNRWLDTQAYKKRIEDLADAKKTPSETTF